MRGVLILCLMKFCARFRYNLGLSIQVSSLHVSAKCIVITNILDAGLHVRSTIPTQPKVFNFKTAKMEFKSKAEALRSHSFRVNLRRSTNFSAFSSCENHPGEDHAGPSARNI